MATIDSQDSFHVDQPSAATPAGLPGWTCVCFAFPISRMTVIQA
jgi:hypothetical protein